MFKLQLASKYFPFDPTHLLKCFSHCSKQFLNLQILIPFDASAFFLFYLFHISKTLLFEDFFHLGRQKKKSLRMRLGEQRGWAGDHTISGQKLLNTQHRVGRCTCKSPIMNWANMLRVLKKNSLKLMQPLTTIPAGSLIQMDSQNTHLEGAYTTRGLPTRR